LIFSSTEGLFFILRGLLAPKDLLAILPLLDFLSPFPINVCFVLIYECSHLLSEFQIAVNEIFIKVTLIAID